jgi:hypothetical protein
MNLESIMNELLELRNQKWWYTHQSRKECILGSDGVGHDFIHPADKLESACRNAWTHLHAMYNMKDKIDERALEIEDVEDELKDLTENSKAEKPAKHARNIMKLQIKINRLKREQDCNIMEFEERKEALSAFLEHIQTLSPIVKARYKDHDDALEHVWMARLAYQAQVKHHPIGHELKTALLDESKKAELLQMMGFPTEMDSPNGKVPLPIPNADVIISSLQKALGE